MRCVTAVVGVGFLVVACGGSSGSSTRSPPSESTPPSGAGHACGVRLFNTPACQQALDSVCCPIAQACADDLRCMQLSECINACKANPGGQPGDNCLNGCAVRARAEYCQSSCEGQDDGCRSTCNAQGRAGEPSVKWMLIADCSKSVTYPDGVECNDRT